MKKKGGAEVENHSLKVWCEHCSIRITPNELRDAAIINIHLESLS
jgi:hypothetical protein